MLLSGSSIMSTIVIRISPPVSNDQLNNLFATAWVNYIPCDFQRVLSRSLLYVCAYHDDQLVRYVNLAWDGGIHSFLLDTTVHAGFQHQGIGVRLVRAAVEAAQTNGMEWVHVDYEPHLREFYRKCGFQLTEAGLIDLKAV
jgi:GNAT superfamily N-acetyltransferase